MDARDILIKPLVTEKLQRSWKNASTLPCTARCYQGGNPPGCRTDLQS